MRNLLSRTQSASQKRKWWDARLAALEAILGRCDGSVWRPQASLRRRGYADVLRFRNYVNGVTYVTAGLIGNPRQVPNKWGQYELMMCMRLENDWAAEMLSRLAQYTLEAAVHPGDTMDIGSARASESTIAGLLFARPDPPADSFTVLGMPANLVLCIGITAAEFAACRNFGSGVVLRMLKENDVYPFTDLQRESVM